MNRRVLWLPDAEAELTTIWVESLHRDEVTSAANEIDAALRRDALDCGESRDAGRRIFLIGPLAITFVVADDTVEVQHAWRIDRR